MQEAELKALLKKYIDHSCTPAELAMLLPYLDRPEGKREMESLLREEWDAFEPTPAEAGLALDWHERISAGRKEKSGRVILAWHRNWLKYAAVLVIAVGLSVVLVHRFGNNTTIAPVAMLETINPKGQRATIILPDSSIVTLGPDSRLQYPENFNGNKREINLQGAAFFEVKQRSDQPFIVHTEEVQTQVLGTSFKIEAFAGQKLRVAVATGKVSVGYQKAGSPMTPLAVLTPGEMMSWNPVSKTAAAGLLAVDDVLDLKNGKLVFTDTRLDVIALQLERWYNTKIILQGTTIQQYSLSITINGQQPVSHALEAIAAATHLQYRMDNHQITLFTNH